MGSCYFSDLKISFHISSPISSGSKNKISRVPKSTLLHSVLLHNLNYDSLILVDRSRFHYGTNRLCNSALLPDDFSHEQSLVFSTPKGLVIFNSCCHGGADNIVREVADTFPGQPISAIVGGFHLYDTPAQEVRAFAHRLGETGVTQVITGHCTGPEALDILTQVLGSRVQPLSTGLVLTF